MKRLLIFAVCLTMNFAAQTPLTNYKLILSSSETESVKKEQLFNTILKDISTNQKKHFNKLEQMNDEQLATHFGKLNHDSSLATSNKEIAPEQLKTTVKQAIQKRSKNIARQIYNMIQKQDLEQIRHSLARTMLTDLDIRQKTKQDCEELQNAGIENKPAAPYYYPRVDGYYSYYGYNYMYNYSYAGNYPYYDDYRYYRPIHRNHHYRYNYNYYSPRYYKTYYYPRYNRTNRLLTTGIFGLATIGAFVDWLND